MSPISDKQQNLKIVMDKYNLIPKRVEVSDDAKEMVFTFETPAPDCDKTGVQRELRDVFDFTGSVSVLIDRPVQEAVNLVPKPVVPKFVPPTEVVPRDPKREEEIQKKLAALRPAGDGDMLGVGGKVMGKKAAGERITLREVDFSLGEEFPEATVTLTGEVFGTETRETKQEHLIVSFNLTDGTGSISCTIFIASRNRGSADETRILANVKNGRTMMVSGRLSYDDYNREVNMDVRYLEVGEASPRTDEAEEKRVELHLHSQYSALDAVSKVEKIMAQAKAFGHDAIGITDHGVLQAYPEMMKYSRKYGIKVLYGVEGYLIQDEIKIVKGEQEADLNGDFIFFDLETTGLSPGRDRIIEVAAVKISDRQITETFSQVVDPGRALPPKITELTGITPELIAAEGIPEEEALAKFVEFCGDRVLVAHNADFDMGFLNIALGRLGIEKTFTSIDTVAMAQALVHEVKRFNLKRLSSFFKIDMGHHHRALDDSISAGKVFIKLIERAQKEGITQISGLNALMDMEKVIHGSRPNHIIIYAKNQTGLKDLYKLVSESHVNYLYRKPLLPRRLIAENRENLIIGSACEAGELYQAVRDKLPQGEVEAIASFYDYLEVQPLDNNAYLVRKEYVESKQDLININKDIIALGDRLGKPVVATGDVHFVDPADAHYREILQAGQKYDDAGQQPPLYYRSTQEMLDEFSYLDADKAYEIVVTNTRKIADLMETVQPIPDDTYPPIIEGSDEEIRTMVMEKAHAMYGEPLPEIVEKRVTRELDSIIGNGYSVLYLIAQKLVDNSVQAGYLVGSRGSVGSSLVAMLCGITEVNSLAPHYVCPNCKHNQFFDSTDVGVGPDLPDADCPKCGHPLIKDGFDIPFETFLGFEGDKEPDIDLNFSGENQADAHNYTEVLFGEGKVYRAGTISTLAEKTAIGYVLGYAEERALTLPRAELSRLAAGCEGVKRTTGQHPGGIMVVPSYKDIYDFTPIQYPADDPECGTLTTHFDYHSISGRLLKLDILGHDDPTMLKMLKDLTGVDPQSIPLDDEKVLSLFTGTEALNLVDDDFPIPIATCGVPEFGTGFVREMVLDTKPKSFSDLIRISGLSHGTDVWIGNAQSLIKSGTASIGEAICTRDDIMIYLISKGLESKLAFTIMEKVRKGKGLTTEDEAEMKKHEVPQWYIDSCKKIKYMFPKAHAAAYVMMAFRIAYYKVYYPLAYYATYFSIRAKEFDVKKMTRGKQEVLAAMAEIKAMGNNAGNKEKGLLVSLELALEMYCRGFGFKNIDLYKSHYNRFQIVDDALLPPLSALDGLGEKAAQQIYEEAKKGEFLSKEDLQRRAKVNKTTVEKLTELGCLSGLPDSNQMSFF